MAQGGGKNVLRCWYAGERVDYHLNPESTYVCLECWGDYNAIRETGETRKGCHLSNEICDVVAKRP